MPPTESAVTYQAPPVQPTKRKIRHVKSSVATVMPEIGFEDEPISPVNRDETVTNRNPNSRMSSAPTTPCRLKPRPRLGVAIRMTMSARQPIKTTRRDKSRSVRGTTDDAEVEGSFARELAAMSRRPDLIDARMSGSACSMLIIPPV